MLLFSLNPSPSFVALRQRLSYFLGLFALLCSFNVVAIPLPEPLLFSETEQVTIAEGLPSNTVFSLRQDKLGFIWAGTPSGLGLLNGYTALTFTHAELPELSTMSPGNIFIDNQDMLWVGTWGKGVKAINRNRTQLIDLEWIGNSLASERIQTIYQARDNAIWVGTFDNGLFRIHPESRTIQSFQAQPGQAGLNHNRIWSMAEDDDGNLWVATSNGLNSLNIESGEFQSFFDSDELSVADKLIRSMLVTGNELWFGTNLGFFKMDLTSNTIERLMPPGRDIISVNRIVANNDSGLWIGTFSGIYYYSRAQQKFLAFANDQYSYLAQKDIRDILVTPREVLLLATRYSGVYKLNLRPKPIQQITNQHYSDQNKLQIWEMAKDDEGNVWAGTNDGIIRFNLKTKSTLKLPAVLENNIKGLTLSVAFSQDKRKLWIGTVNRLYQYDMQTGELRSFNEQLELSQLNHIRLFVDKEDNLWVNSAHQGVLKVSQSGDSYHYHTGAAPPHKLPDNNIAQLSESLDGKLWMVTGNSELLYKRAQDTDFTRLPLQLATSEQDANFIATSLHTNRNNDVYVGTYSGLLTINADTGNTQRLTISDGLANDEIRGIASDWPGNIWVSTGTGITRISADGSDLRSYGRIDGLNSPSMNLRSILNCTDNMMCFGSSNGINYIQELESWDSDHNENIIISNLWINQEKQPYPSTGDNYLNLILRSDERNIKFQFGKIDHRPAATHELYFRLEGFDDKWYASDVSRIANYTNLQPGSYVFEVTDSPTHYQKHNSAKVVIEIIPPFWSRLWVQVAAVISGLAILTLGYQTRINQIRRNEQKLNRLVEVRTRNMALLGDIGMEITRSLNFQEIFYNLQKHLKSILTEHDFMMGLVNEEKNALNFDLVISNFESLSRHSLSVAEQPELCVQCFKDNKEIVINSIIDKKRALQEGMKLQLMHDYASCVCLPLEINGNTIGVIFVRSRNENAYGEYERQFLRTIAAYTAVALKNARFYQEQKQTHEKRITWLENITHYLNHEMKNSILGAQTSLNMLNRKIKDNELHKYVDRAEKSHKEMRSIMKAVSETTSLEASIMQTSSAEFDVSQVISERLEDYQAIYPQASIVGKITPFVFIRGNEGLIVQCLDKLVNNAIEHHNPGSDIEVNVQLIDSNCVISVSNVGDPLPDNIDEIFKLFTSTKTDARKGNFGMGLYVARLIADFHNGQISAGPLVQGYLQGAIFELRIPIE